MSASTEGFAPNLSKWLKSLSSEPDPERSLELLIPYALASCPPLARLTATQASSHAAK